MNRHPQFILIIPLLLALAGCGQGTNTGTTGGSRASTDVQDSSGFSLSKVLDIGKGARANVSMPTSALIADAAREIVRTESLDVQPIREELLRTALKQDWTPIFLAEALVARLFQGDGPDFKAAAQSLDEWALQLPHLAPHLAAPFRAKHRCAQLGADDDKTASKTCFFEHFQRVMAAVAIVIAHGPRNGWEISPLDQNRNVGKAMDKYLLGNAGIVEFSSLIESEIAGNLSGRVLRDPSAAKAAILKALWEMPIERLRDAAAQASDLAYREYRAGITFNLKDAKGIDWTAGGTYYSGTQNGWSIVRNGADWFGGGFANGKRYELALETSISARQSKSAENSGSTSTSSGVGAGGDAQVR